MSLSLDEAHGLKFPDIGGSRVSDADIALMQRLLRAVASKPDDPVFTDFMSYLLDVLQVGRLVIPAGQVLGFDQFLLKFASVTTNDFTTSSTYGDLTGGSGPEIDGLPDGQYALLYGCTARPDPPGSGLTQSFYSPKINATEATNADAFQPDPGTTGTTLFQGGGFACLKTLANGGNNTVRMRYKGTGTTRKYYFLNRWLFAFRYGNV